tara:strand:+ start:423 stop:1013 length:591 start_codon:yes stop_codon:yes gene_type:complete
MSISAVSLETPFGTVRKLSNGLYRLRNSAPSIRFLLEIEHATFSFLIDEGFVIKSYKYTKKKKGEKETLVDIKNYKHTNITCLPDMLDYMAVENFSQIHLYTTSLVVDLERYRKFKLGIMFVPSNEKRAGIQITKVMKGGLAERYGLKDNDIILKVNNSEVNFQSDLQNQFANNTTYLLTIKRANKTHKIKILNSN